MAASKFRSFVTLGAALAVCAVTASGCTSVRRAVGAEKVAPDEFRVVTKAPLAIPPEYNLRPPKPGEPRPQEFAPSDAARGALLGGVDGAQASNAEQLLVAKAGAAQAEPGIRTLVDVEASGTVRKSTGFANRVLFWNNGDVADEANPVDAVSEEERLRREALIDDATGGQDVVIKRDGGVKLPGL